MHISPTVRYRRVRLAVCGLAVSLLGSTVLLSAASADPVADKQGQARALAQQIDALGRTDAALAEQYDKATLAVQSAKADIEQSTARANQAETDATRARSLLSQDSLDAYMHSGGLASRLGGVAGGADTAFLRAAYVQTLASTETEHLDGFRAAAAQAKAAAGALLVARQQAMRSVAQLDSARQATLASQRQLQGTLGQVKGDIAIQVAQLEAAKQASATAQAQQRLAQLQAAAAVPVAAAAGAPVAAAAGAPVAAAAGAATRTATAVAAPLRSLPALLNPVTSPAPAPAPRPAAPVGSGGAAAVAAAKSRLGLPYVWGAAGPDSFDCSGLTLWAWAHAGVSLPHFSGAQYASITHIPMADLQPGDLVFFADTGAHVAMYIGGGQIIAAPHSGTVVQIQPLWSGYVYAGRP